MDTKLDFLPTYKKVLRTFRIYPNANLDFSIIDKIIATILYGMLFMSLAFLFIDAQSVNDLTAGIYSASIYLLYTIVYTVLMKGKFILFELIADAELVVTIRE